MTEYKSREEVNKLFAYDAEETDGDIANTIRLADLAVLREWAKEQNARIDEYELGYNQAISELISFITSCEAKLK